MTMNLLLGIVMGLAMLSLILGGTLRRPGGLGLAARKLLWGALIAGALVALALVIERA